ncbi:MAG: DUF4199 domain-containing protein [Ignavibacteria bacterium]|nr:DUF4199 domain-containing protein [Ignavibacteria bacterium]
MKNFRIEIKWAVIFFIMMLAWMVIEKLAGFHDRNIESHAVFSNFIAIPAVAVYVLALLDKKKNFYGETMTFRQGFMTGLVITIFVTILSPLTQFITSTYITPDYFMNAIEFAVSSGNASREQAEAYFNLQSYIFQGLIGTPVMGVITSVIVAFIVKSKKPAEDNTGAA